METGISAACADGRKPLPSSAIKNESLVLSNGAEPLHPSVSSAFEEFISSPGQLRYMSYHQQ